MDWESLVHRNDMEVNKVVAKCLRITILFFIALWLFAMSDYYSGDKLIITVIFIACVLLFLIPTVLVDILHLENYWVKYYFLACMISVLLLLSIFVSYDLIIIGNLALFIATFYCERKLILITAVLDFACILGTMILRSFMFGAILQKYKNYKDALIYGVLFQIILVMISTLFAYYIVERNKMMLNKTLKANQDLMHSQEELIYAFAEISESKSKVTGEHIRRVSEYMRILGSASGFTTDYVEKLTVAAMMHDIGKLMISEEILDKPDKLTDEEYAIMKNHVLYGEALLSKCPGDIMKIARTIALEHHERWDGTGYLGMKGTDISYISRLMAVCDVFDALTSQRYYKEGWSLEDTYNEIVRLSGTHFDPDVVQLFVENFDKFKDVLKNIPDKEIY